MGLLCKNIIYQIIGMRSESAMDPDRAHQNGDGELVCNGQLWARAVLWQLRSYMVG